MSYEKNVRRVEQLMEELSSEGEDFSTSECEYTPSEDDGSSQSELMETDEEQEERVRPNELLEDNSLNVPRIPTATTELPKWIYAGRNFTPRFEVPPFEKPAILNTLASNCTALDSFFAMFPKSLFIFIAQCTNERLIIEDKGVRLTDQHEIMIVVGVLLVMSYNRLADMKEYWSNKKSKGNRFVKMAISRDRFLKLSAKLYFNHPEKPANASKLYYIEEVTNCLKYSFQKCREDSSVQSIDESMAKFKGRSALKQYLPLKPIKRGIKIWERCDSSTGYCYDFNVYAGKEVNPSEGTLGERVVNRLVSSVKKTGIVFCFDRFFTTTQMIDTLPHPAVGTCMLNRKNLPTMTQKLPRGESRIYGNQFGATTSFWQDTKLVTVLSNCHGAEKTTVQRKLKSGKRVNLLCPTSIAFYNKYMGGVDLSDQRTTVYDVDRRSAKWWKKVFYKLLMTACVNSSIIYKEATGKNVRYLDYLTDVAEDLILTGRANAAVDRRQNTGRTSRKNRRFINVGDHMPVEGTARRRCVRCADNKVGRTREKRTTFTCLACEVPLCFACFTPYHTN